MAFYFVRAARGFALLIFLGFALPTYATPLGVGVPPTQITFQLIGGLYPSSPANFDSFEILAPRVSDTVLNTFHQTVLPDGSVIDTVGTMTASADLRRLGAGVRLSLDLDNQRRGAYQIDPFNAATTAYAGIRFRDTIRVTNTNLEGFPGYVILGFNLTGSVDKPSPIPSLMGANININGNYVGGSFAIVALPARWGENLQIDITYSVGISIFDSLAPDFYDFRGSVDYFNTFTITSVALQDEAGRLVSGRIESASGTDYNEVMIPEPQGMALAGLGLAWLAGKAWARRRQEQKVR